MSAGERRTSKPLPIACELSEAGLRERREELSRGLFAGCRSMRELEDGYEVVFPGGGEWIERLARFVAAERECCGFLSFELRFEPAMGPVSLRMRGPEGTREFLATQFEGATASAEKTQADR
jgi:hypothetical protein